MNSAGWISRSQSLRCVITFNCGFDHMNNIRPDVKFMVIPLMQIADQLEHPPLSYGLFSKGMWRVFMFVYQKLFIQQVLALV